MFWWQFSGFRKGGSKGSFPYPLWGIYIFAPPPKNYRERPCLGDNLIKSKWCSSTVCTYLMYWEWSKQKVNKKHKKQTLPIFVNENVLISSLYRKDTIEPLYHSFMYSLVSLLSSIYPFHYLQCIHCLLHYMWRNISLLNSSYPVNVNINYVIL